MTRRRVSNPLALAVLSCLSERPMHPYEISTTLRTRGKEQSIKLNYGSLYSVVESLQKHGLITVQETTREGKRPERTVYAITDAGRDAVRSTLEQMLGEFVNEFPEFPVAVGEAHNLPPERVAELLAERAARIREFTAFIDAGLTHIAEKGVARHYVLNVHYTRAMLTAELDWLAHTIDELRSGRLHWTASTD